MTSQTLRHTHTHRAAVNPSQHDDITVLIRCWSHHDAVGLADGPQVDPAVLPSCGQQAAGAFPQSQTGNAAGVSLELLCTATQEGHRSFSMTSLCHETTKLTAHVQLCSFCCCIHTTLRHHCMKNVCQYSRSRHEILVVLAAAILVTLVDWLLCVNCCCSIRITEVRHQRLVQLLHQVTWNDTKPADSQLTAERPRQETNV